jgi:hypothetical protein
MPAADWFPELKSNCRVMATPAKPPPTVIVTSVNRNKVFISDAVVCKVCATEIVESVVTVNRFG